VNIATQGFDDGEAKNESNSDLPATKWHYDSYPFVCVVMLSDTTNMVGGETAIRKPSGEVIRVRGPQRVCFTYFLPWPSLLMCFLRAMPLSCKDDV
jgi:hypothetical protein